MIAEHLLSPEEASGILSKAGYEPATLRMESHSLWKSPGGLHLWVPHLPPNDMVCERVLRERMAEVDAANRNGAH